MDVEIKRIKFNETGTMDEFRGKDPELLIEDESCMDVFHTYSEASEEAPSTEGDEMSPEPHEQIAPSVAEEMRDEVTATGPHPLANHVVLEHVFGYLSVNELKQCRLVCKLWDDLGTPIMLSKGIITVDTEDITKLITLQSWMNSDFWYGSPAHREPNKTRFFQHIVCDNITHASYPNIWGILGSHVRSFNVSSWWNDNRDLTLEDYEDLLMRRCPNLEEITMPSTEKFTKADKFLEFTKEADNTTTLNLRSLSLIGEIKPDDRFWRIITLSPHLKNFRVDCEINEEFWNPFPFKKDFETNMRNLDVLEVKSYGNESVTNASGQYFFSRPWTLKTLDYENYGMADSIVRDCSERVKDTCERLVIGFFNRKYAPWPADRDKEWMVTPRMKKLKHFILEIDDHCEGPILVRAAVLAIYVPQLVSLRLGTYEDAFNWNERDWEDGMFQKIYDDLATPQDRNIRRETVKMIKLPPKFQDLSCVAKFTEIFPNIEELELHTPSPEAFAAIVSQWKKIRRLKITMVDTQTVNWSSVLTGVEIFEDPVAAEEGEEKTKFVYTGVSLADLHELTALEINLIPELSLNEVICPLNDLLIYYAFLALPYLQYVHVRGHQFSMSAVNELREKALPFCYLDLYDRV